MSEKDEKLNKGKFLYINDEEKAEWGQPEGYPYKIEDKIMVFEETALPFTYQGLYQGIDYANVSDVHFVEGDTYIVNFDGTEHVCVCKVVGKFVILGNPKYGYGYGLDGFLIDTGEPFLIIDYPNHTKGPYFIFRGPNKGTFTVSIVHDKSKTYPMAPEFLPGTVILYPDAENYLYANKTDTTDTSKRLTYTKVRDIWLSGQNIIVTNVIDNETETMIIHLQITGIYIEKNKETNETFAGAISVTGDPLYLVIDIKL